MPGAALVVAVIHGPNLNLLGTREPSVYGHVTLAEIDRELVARGAARGVTVETFQSNSEGALVDHIHEVAGRARVIVINPAAYTHTSIAIGDALRAVGLPAVEVHLSNLHRRESYRQTSYTAAACVGTIAGFGAQSYYLALEAALGLCAEHGNA